MSHKMFSFVLCITLLASLIGLIPTTVVQAAKPEPETAAYPYATDHLIVKLRAEARVEKGTTSTHIASLDRALAEMNATALEAVPGLSATYLVELDSKSADILGAVETLNNDPAVEYAEPDYLAKFASAPDDPRYSEQWGLAKVQAEGAWDETLGSPMVVIAIIDSGIDLAHEDLAPNLWLNPGEIAGNSLDDDNNGFIDDVQGWNFVNATNDVQDFIGHGSLVAGVAAAKTNNTLGIAGMCGNCRIMPVKITQVSGFANYSDIAAGVNYAVDKGAKVINLSVGGYADSITVKNAINNALSKGIVVVGGVGNDNKSDKFYPAAYEGVIAVAGTDASDVRVASSNYGAWVDISAPGQNILSTTLGDYSSDTGTSYATPFVSGAAGLLLSLHPEWTPAMVRSQFLHTTDSIDSANPGFAGMLGSGRLNTALATQPSHPILTYKTYAGNDTPELRPDFGSTVALNITLYNDWADAAGVTGTLSSTDPNVTLTTTEADFGTIPAGASQANAMPFSFDIAAAAGYNHAMPFTLALSANGGGYTTTVNFTITTRTSEELVSGTIDTDTTWTNDKTYKVTGNVGVAPGFTLTIQPGTVVKFAGHYSLNLGGTLIAQGTAAQPIRFEPTTAGGTWERIFIDDPAEDGTSGASGEYLSGTSLSHVVIQGAASGLQCNSATPLLSYLTITSGGIDCTPGETPFNLSNSSITGNVSVSGIELNPWISRANQNQTRFGFATAADDNHIYTVGGTWPDENFSTLEIYDPISDSWSFGAAMPTARVFAAAAAAGGKVFVIGGGNASTLSTVEAYDIATNQWETRASMPTARDYLSAVALDGKIYAVGGINVAHTPTEVVEVYDPVADNWTTLASLPAARISCGLVALSGKIYAIGGSSSYHAESNVYEYDPGTNAWTERASLPVPQSYSTAASFDGKIFVAHGSGQAIDIYDPLTNTWTTYPPLIRDTPVNAVVIGNSLYVLWDAYLEELNVSKFPFPNVANTTIMGSLSLGDKSLVTNSNVTGTVTIGIHSRVDTSTTGGISTGIYGTVEDNLVNGLLTMGSGTAQRNQITGGSLVIGAKGILNQNVVKLGGINAGSGSSITDNTIITGGISSGAGSTINHNSVEESPTNGISASGTNTISYNRVAGSMGHGIVTGGGVADNNLIAITTGDGIRPGTSSVRNNTLIGIAGNGVFLDQVPAAFEYNNFEFNTGAYDVYVTVPKTATINLLAQNNWWGTTDSNLIKARIYDYNDGDFNLAKLITNPVLTAPSQTAPGYVRSVTLNPASPVGIQTVDYTVEFSRPMNTETDPQVLFHSIWHNTWTVYNTGNSGLPGNEVYSIAVDSDGSHWFGTSVDGGGAAHFDGTNWTVYQSHNSGLPHRFVGTIVIDADGSKWFVTWGEGVTHFDGTNWTRYDEFSGLPDTNVMAIAVDTDGSKWFGTQVGGVAQFDGTTWTVYNTGNSGLPNNFVRSIAIDADGSKWFGTEGFGVAHFDGTTWTMYNTGNSGLPDNFVYEIAVDADGSKWFGTTSGVTHFDGTTWTVYNTGNSGLPGNSVSAIAVDADGSKWFGTNNGVGHFDGTTWTVYNTGNSGLPSNSVSAIAIDADGSKWFGTGIGVGVLWNDPEKNIQNNPSWLDDTYFQASYDFTTLIERGDYRLTVADAVDGGGMTIVPDRGTTFSVDYAGEISDTTPPAAPLVSAWGNGSLTQLSAQAAASDPESEVVAYRYAIGSTLGGSDVVNWTNTAYTEITRTGLILQPDQPYYVSFQARNLGGLWSDIGSSNPVVNGQMPIPTPTIVSLNPASIVAGGTAFALTVTGTNFVSNSVVRWNGSNRATTFVSATQLTAQIPAADIATAGDYLVTVYTPAPGGGTSNAVNFNVAVPNSPPVAVDDSYTTDEDTELTIADPGVLGNDTDADSDSLTAVKVTNPAHGTLTLNANGSFAYSPTVNWNGIDSFTYKANDGTADSNTATVTLTVTAVNDMPVANAQSVSTSEDTAKAISLTASDPDDTTFTWTIVASPAHGSLSGTAPNITYTPAANYNGADSFTFKVNDGDVDSNTATVSINVTAVNDVPVADAQSVSTTEDAAKAITLTTTDLDDTTFTWTIVTPPTNGTLSDTAPNVTYTPAANYSGADSFTFKVNDGDADSNIATVSINVTAVNDVPVANAQSVSTTEDTDKAITLTASDPDDTSFTWAIVTPPAHGALSGTAPNITYTPAANYNGADSFTFKVNDGDVDSNTATVSINITTVNDVPVANDQSVSTTEDAAKAITLTATDPDDTNFTWTIVTQPAHGALSGTAPDITYTPAANYSGADGFTFKVNDGDVDSNTATVSITVTQGNTPPVAVDDSYSMDEDTVLSIVIPGVLGNDTDADSDPLTAVLVSGPAHGTLTLNADGSFTYTPDANWYGTETFTYKANDGIEDSNVATVTITVADMPETRSIYLPLIHR